MKKALTILFLTLYVTFSVGVNIAVHTCGGESEALLVTTAIEDPCGCGDEPMPDKCCTTELKTVQLDEFQKATLSTISEQLVLIDVLPAAVLGIRPVQDPEFSSHFLALFSPPPNDDLCVVNSVFLI